MSFRVPETKRVKNGPLRSTEADGKNGAFSFYIGTTHLFAIASDGGGWEHVSVSNGERTPTWTEMCAVKAMFWEPEDCVIQFHPPASEYVDNHPNCLHLWRKSDVNFETPPTWMIGVKR